MQPTFGEAKVRISEKKTKFFIMFFFKTTSFLGESGLQTMRLNVTFTPFVTFKLRKLFIHLRKTPNILTQQGSNIDAQGICDVLGVF